MKNEQAVKAAFEYAAERYAAIGVDVNEVLKKMQGISLSLHCWQTDDVSGFENPDGELTGGIQATGNYPGKARNIDEVRADLLKVKSLLPGSHRINLHEVYGDFGGKKVDRDEVTPDHFTSWMQWAKENGLKLDFNSTSFSHPKSGMLTLANPDDSIREFWVEHTRRCRWIADEMGKSERSLYHESLDSRRFQRYDRQQALLPSVVGTVSRPYFRYRVPAHERLYRSQTFRYRSRELYRGVV